MLILNAPRVPTSRTVLGDEVGGAVSAAGARKVAVVAMRAMAGARVEAGETAPLAVREVYVRGSALPLW